MFVNLYLLRRRGIDSQPSLAGRHDDNPVNLYSTGPPAWAAWGNRFLGPKTFTNTGSVWITPFMVIIDQLHSWLEKRAGSEQQ
jgi:hypothetical protein